MNREELYFRAPRPVQNLLSSAAGLGVDRARYGHSFLEAEQGFNDRSTWSADALLTLARSRRAQALARASQTTYYQKTFRELGAEWHELIDDASFRKIPPTPKKAFRARPQDFAPRPQIVGDAITRTSGTTGSSIQIIRSRAAVDEQWAVWWRYRSWHGIQRGEPCALFAGRRIMRADQGGKYWRSNLPGNELRFSTYHVSPKTAHLYVNQLNRFGARWIHGFSSAIANLARCIVEQNLRVDSPISWVTLGGENVTTTQSQTIHEAFGVRPVQHFGLAEGVANFSTCTEGNLHVDEDFAWVDFDSNNGLTRILGTGFSNSAQVLLRYDTGDIASVDTNQQHCRCGFGGRIVSSLDGRGDETIRLPDGRLVGSPEDAFRKDLGVAEAQLRQTIDGSVTALVVPGRNWGQTSPRLVESALREFLGHEILITVTPVSEIARTAGGKKRLVVQEIN